MGFVDQVATLSDVPRVFVIAFLEMLLSADNAIVLGLISHSLEKRLRKKALFIGLSSAFVFRFLAILGISYFLSSHWIQSLGGLYLIYLSIQHFLGKKRRQKEKKTLSFWKAVLLIELLDLVFAIDSMLAGVAFVDANPSKIWLVYVGGTLGVLGIRWAADIFSSFLTTFPRLETSAYLMVALVGVKLVLLSLTLYVPDPLFWLLSLLIFLLGFYPKKQIQ